MKGSVPSFYLGEFSKGLSRLSLKGVRKFKLDNGLTVLFHKSDNVPIVSVDMWVKTGSVNENKSINGISHFLEHMLFKDTKSYPNNCLSHQIENLGGYINASTSLDYTHYYIILQKEKVDKAFNVLSEMAFNLIIKQEELDRERGVIIEEIQRGQDSPYSVLWESLYKNSFNGHPYANPIIGNKKNVRNISREDMQKYYTQYYAPSNIVLVISGDIDDKRLDALLEKYFSSSKTSSLKINSSSVLKYTPKLDKNLLAESYMKSINQTYFSYSWYAPCIYETGYTELYVLSNILGDGISSRLYRYLKQEKALVWSVDSDLSDHKYGSLFTIYGTCDYDKVSQIHDEILVQINNIIKGISPDELAKAKKMIEMEYYLDLETNSQITQALGYYETIDIWEDVNKIKEDVDSLDIDTISYHSNLVFNKNFIKQLVIPDFQRKSNE
ncbi:M16 family metallopeptidase [bacterium]